MTSASRSEGPAAAPAVAVAVVSWNTRDLLARCLDSLADAAGAGLAEVWVIDNGSSDGSVAMVEERYPWVRLVAGEDNLGFGAAVNEVAVRTESEWLAAANADIALAAGALARLLAVGRADARIGAVAPALITPGGDSQHSVHPFPSPSLALLFNLGVYRVVPGLGERLCLEGHWDPSRPRDVDWAHGALLLLRRSAFDAVGGFDRTQWMYAEDIDLQWRLSRAGWSTRYEPAARVRHELSAATTQAFGAERLARHLAASYAWLHRRRGPLVAMTCAALNTAGACSRWLGAAALAAAKPGEGHAADRRRFASFARLHARELKRSTDLRREVAQVPSTRRSAS